MNRMWMVEARKEKGLTVTELANEMNVCRSHITQIEKGDKSPSGKLGLKLSRLLDVKLEKFYEYEVELEERELVKN